MPPNASFTSTSGTVPSGRSELRPAAVVFAGAKRPSTVRLWRVEGCRSKRPNEVTPVVPMFGEPESPVTPATGTRSKLNSVDAKKRAMPIRPPA
jgi:hypothetical protein